jgi:signal transduction histidine kinase
MTPQRLVSLWAGRPVKLRATLLAVAFAAGVYASGLPLYLYFRVSRPALALGELTAGVATVSEDLVRRDSALDQLHLLLTRLAGRPVGGSDALGVAHRLLALGQVAVEVPLEITVPRALRVAWQRSNAAYSRVASALGALVAALDAGRRPTSSQLAAAEALDHAADELRANTALLAAADLVARQRDLQQTASASRRDTLLWLGIGLLLAIVLFQVVHRRLWRPLSELETGLAQVAEGDLTVRVPVGVADEIGRLAEHFNAMTRVLRDRAEEQGRFAAAGELLAGVAHEVNNPLMAIAAHAENRLADPGLADEARSEMSQILRQARRAAKLLRGLLRFVRATDREVGRVNLNDVVRGALDLVSYRFSVDEITVGGRLDPNLPAVEGDAIKLEQVVVNLLANAIDALRYIRPPRHLTVDTWTGDARVCAAVGDNGRGVAPEIGARLFRPFATTKGHRGTGLGLYISRQIAREAGGDLALVSPAGSGARFVLSLPLAAPVPARAAAPALAPSGPPEAERAPVALVSAPPAAAQPASPGARPAAAPGLLGGVRVLIVDDEEGVRRPMARFLTRRGATVEEAGDGLEALTRLANGPADVILADLRMPRMSGIELYAKLEEERPELAARVLFLSGDVSQLAEPGNTPVPRERVLVKPVELAELERRLASFVGELGRTKGSAESRGAGG